MRNNSIIPFIIFYIIILLIDLYAFRGIKSLTVSIESKLKYVIYFGFWLIPLLIVIGIFIMYLFRSKIQDPGNFNYVYYLIGLFVLFYIPKLVFISFLFVEDVVKLLAVITKNIFKESEPVISQTNKISRSQFISQAGIIVAAIPFISIIHGILRGRFNYKVRKYKLGFTNLPEVYNGFKILQISDLHIGSFSGYIEKLEKAIDLINRQKADMILFTVDLVNNYAIEVDEFVPILKKLKARYGKY